MNEQIPEDQLAAIKEAIFKGHKIQAIKLYRDTTNTGLKEAKDAADKLESELRAASPEKFAVGKAPSGGCLNILLILCILILLASIFLLIEGVS